MQYLRAFDPLPCTPRSKSAEVRPHYYKQVLEEYMWLFEESVLAQKGTFTINTNAIALKAWSESGLATCCWYILNSVFK